MAKANTAEQADSVSTFPVPFSIEEFRKDIANVFFHFVRGIAWMTDPETAWAITKAPALEYGYSLFHVDVDAEDLGLHYEYIRDTNFAVYMEHLYSYGFLGILDTSNEAMEDESIHTWLSALICDAAEGEFAVEYGLYTAVIAVSAERCLKVVETANARVTLEGGEPFFARFQSGKDGYQESELLTVRQLALLSGMEEMSIRAAAGPSRANPLRTVKTDGGTRIAIDVAKEWLISKGRYVPISKSWTAGHIDLTKQRFSDHFALVRALQARCQMLCDERGSDSFIAKARDLEAPIVEGNNRVVIEFDGNEAMMEPAFVRKLAALLDLPEDLLVLRVLETQALERLEAIQYEVKIATAQ